MKSKIIWRLKIDAFSNLETKQSFDVVVRYEITMIEMVIKAAMIAVDRDHFMSSVSAVTLLNRDLCQNPSFWAKLQQVLDAQIAQSDDDD